MRLVLFPAMLLSFVTVFFLANAVIRTNAAVQNGEVAQMAQHVMDVMTSMKSEKAPVQKQDDLASKLNDIDVGAGE